MSFVFFFSKIIVFCSSLILCSFLFFFFLSFCCLLSSSTLSIFAGLLLRFLLALQVATAYTHKRASHTHTNAYNRKTFAQTQFAPTYTHTTQLLYNTNDDKRQMIMKSLSVDLLQSSNMNFHKTKFLLLVPSFRFLRCYTSLLLIFFT